jgi:serine phosphatase RsbU (regulator of sigma subunit)
VDSTPIPKRREVRFVEERRAAQDLEQAPTVDRMLASVQEYSGGTQLDDLTLLVAQSVV